MLICDRLYFLLILKICVGTKAGRCLKKFLALVCLRHITFRHTNETQLHIHRRDTQLHAWSHYSSHVPVCSKERSSAFIALQYTTFDGHGTLASGRAHLGVT